MKFSFNEDKKSILMSAGKSYISKEDIFTQSRFLQFLHLSNISSSGKRFHVISSTIDSAVSRARSIL